MEVEALYVNSVVLYIPNTTLILVFVAADEELEVWKSIHSITSSTEGRNQV